MSEERRNGGRGKKREEGVRTIEGGREKEKRS